MAAAGDPEADMEPALDAALIQIADDFISSAVAFGSGLARRRKSSKLDAADVSVYLEQTWYDTLASKCNYLKHFICIAGYYHLHA